MLSKHGINIGGMHFGREGVGGLAISLLDVDAPVNNSVIKELNALPNVISTRKIDLV